MLENWMRISLHFTLDMFHLRLSFDHFSFDILRNATMHGMKLLIIRFWDQLQLSRGVVKARVFLLLYFNTEQKPMIVLTGVS